METKKLVATSKTEEPVAASEATKSNEKSEGDVAASEAPKLVEKSKEDFLNLDLEALGHVRSLIAGENVSVILRIGNVNSPSYREVRMPHTAREIKSRA